MCFRNFGHCSELLQAELHVLNGDCEAAKTFYEASIVSAREHGFVHCEAKAQELYGIFCLESKLESKGHKQLQKAVRKYKQWGALKKAAELQHFAETMHPSFYNSMSRIKPVLTGQD